jgi:carbon-monoxide dehydrogenase large subunit
MAERAPSPPRRESRRLVAGRGAYAGDIALPRMLHAAFLRSPHARARIAGIDAARAAKMPGVAAIFLGADLAAIAKPFRTTLAHMPEHASPPQPALAATAVHWQGEAVAAVAAETRAAAQDAAEAIAVEWDAEDAVADPEAAWRERARPVHDALTHNRALDRTLGTGDFAAAGAGASAVVERRLVFGRHTGVPLEPRTILADYSPAEDTLIVWQSHQVPHQMQGVFAEHLGLPEHRVRVICRDVGGAFGIKLHAYPDELAVAAMAKALGRPVKWVCERGEAFLTDCHSREFRIVARIAADPDGAIRAFEGDLLNAAGAYSIYPRASTGDAAIAAMVHGAPYRVGAIRNKARTVYQNKTPSGSYRGVGQTVGCAVTELLIDDAAAALRIDPVEYRRRAFHRPTDYPLVAASGLRFDRASQHECLDRVVADMDYAALRREQKALAARGILRGIGVTAFVEQTAPGPALYGAAGVRVSSQDGCLVKLEPDGAVRVAVGSTDQGQGTNTGIAQIVAGRLGISLDRVLVDSGDTNGPYGGGAWASRGLSIGGEAAWLAADALRTRLLAIAGALLQAKPEALDLRADAVVAAGSRETRMKLSELARIAHFRPDQVPPGVPLELAAFRQFAPATAPYFVANGAQACHLEIDGETGQIRLLGFWVAEDCGPVVNPALVDGQLRGGAVQGIGTALWEECVYDSEGQLLSGSLLDYALPRADALPFIGTAHVATRQPGTALGIKGAGEGGAVGAAAAVWCAANDALRPLGKRIDRAPFTPERVLRALGRL